MNNTIWKFNLAPSLEQNLYLPVGAEVLSAHVQGDRICIWAHCDDTLLDFPDDLDDRESHTFWVVPTGRPFEKPSLARFLGTVLMHNGALVFHIYTRRS